VVKEKESLCGKVEESHIKPRAALIKFSISVPLDKIDLIRTSSLKIHPNYESLLL
jgi:hypothetical protein